MAMFVKVARKSANGVVSCIKAASLPPSQHWKLSDSSVVTTESEPANECSEEQTASSRKRRKLLWL